MTAAAQPAGGIEGSVVDANGSPLPGVVVTVTGPGVREERVTGAGGRYSVAGLAAADYLVTAILPGFETVELAVGAKANRFIDPMNLGGVEVSQGTADIASRSVEALGGTFDYLTDDPAAERTYTASTTIVANNLLDKAYLSAITENAAWLGAPRTVSITATVSF